VLPQQTPIGFLPLRRFSWRNPLTPGLPHPVCSAYRLFQPLSGLLLHRPGGPVSCLIRPWGSTRKGSPHTNPCSSRSRSPPAVGWICHPLLPWSSTRSAGHPKVPTTPHLDFRGFSCCESVHLLVVLPTAQGRSSRVCSPLRNSPQLRRLLTEPPPMCFEHLTDRSHLAALHFEVSSNSRVG
jgi:hypothetical protein